MRLVLDAGALIALERGDRAMWRRYEGDDLAALATGAGLMVAIVAT